MVINKGLHTGMYKATFSKALYMFCFLYTVQICGNFKKPVIGSIILTTCINCKWQESEINSSSFHLPVYAAYF